MNILKKEKNYAEEQMSNIKISELLLNQCKRIQKLPKRL